MKKSPALLGVLPVSLLLAFLAAACGSSAKDDGKTSVIASFYPFAYVVEQVGGSFVDVTNLTSPGVEPHDLELRPKQVGAVQDGDLVVYEKHFQSAVDDAVDQSGRSAADTVDVSAIVKLKPLQAGAEDGGHDDAGGGGGKQDDPHVWLDPENMAIVTKAVAAKLAKIDPAHATEFAANARRLEAQLADLDSAFASGLEKCRTRTIVTSHAAFQYLAAHYGLTQVPIAGLDPTNEPSPAQLASITQLVRREKITTIFTEELVSPAIARTIARETGASTATLDPIEGLSDDTKGQTYLTLMRYNLDTLMKANSCP
ncbi:metal ABC transporter substrate-binding protein [Aeromicrobium sp.]|uniref:metal ABC transporter substrate-binding protein n=1 Tax=Aeromicrobium sp. TaxID=1871063 RepID=UPI0019B0060F|nr:metal ABC transporter substrate-binding protein [Aeromicrobium sp.]MBC7632721.1 zinc ABC transporter substrate-binding protein [Aeromicrobium sp.]